MAKKKLGLTPTHDYVLIKQEKADTKSPGGIVLPDQASKQPNRGEVLAIGPGVPTAAGCNPICCQVGQVVYFTEYSGIDVKLDGEEYRLLRDGEIIAILEQ